MKLRTILCSLVASIPLAARERSDTEWYSLTVRDSAGNVVTGVTAELFGRVSEGEWTSLGTAAVEANLPWARWSLEESAAERFVKFRFELRTLGLGEIHCEVDRVFRKVAQSLELPDCGFLRIEGPLGASGSVEFQTPVGAAAAKVLLTEGIAVLPVALGTSFFRFQVRPLRRSPLPQGKIAGPLVSGEICARKLVGVEREFAQFRGRFVDFAGEPVVRTKVQVATQRFRRVEDSEFSVTTDEEGRFAVPQFEPLVGRCYQFHLPLDETRGRMVGLFAYRSIPAAEAGAEAAAEFAGEIDLGDVMLLPVDASDVLQLFSDESLSAGYATVATPSKSEYEGTCFQRHAFLREMARRGGSFLEVLDDLGDGFTAQVLRCRARGEPDPVEIQVHGLSPEGVLEYTFPQRIHWQGELLDRSLVGVSYSHFDLQANQTVLILFDEGGREVERRNKVHMGIAPSETLHVGEVQELDQWQDDLYPWIPPGTYRAKVIHSPEVSFPEGRNWRAAVRIESPEFTIRMRPLRIELRRSEVDLVDQWVDQIDTSVQPVTVRRPWNESMRYRGEAESPEDRIFRMGVRAVPVLIDRLEQEQDAIRLLWIECLLNALTGLHRPVEQGLESRTMWPTVVAGGEEAVFSRSHRGPGEDPVPIWTRERAYLEVEVCEDR